MRACGKTNSSIPPSLAPEYKNRHYPRHWPISPWQRCYVAWTPLCFSHWYVFLLITASCSPAAQMLLWCFLLLWQDMMCLAVYLCCLLLGFIFLVFFWFWFSFNDAVFLSLACRASHKATKPYVRRQVLQHRSCICGHLASHIATGQVPLAVGTACGTD